MQNDSVVDEKNVHLVVEGWIQQLNDVLEDTKLGGCSSIVVEYFVDLKPRVVGADICVETNELEGCHNCYYYGPHICFASGTHTEVTTMTFSEFMIGRDMSVMKSWNAIMYVEPPGENRTRWWPIIKRPSVCEIEQQKYLVYDYNQARFVLVNYLPPCITRLILGY